MGLKNLVMYAVLLLLIAPPLFAADRTPQGNGLFFTDEDLEKYRNPSERKKAVEDSTTPKSRSAPGEGDVIGAKRRLRRYEVPYKAYEGTSKRIIIPVTFNGSVTAPMILDTGAMGMHISAALAEKLDIFERDEGKLLESTSGIGGSAPAVLTIIDAIQVGGLEERFVPTKVTQAFSEAFDGIIGMDFMSNFSIQIDTRKHVVIFEEHPPGPGRPGGHDEDWWRSTFRQFASKRAEWNGIRQALAGERDDSKRLKTGGKGGRIQTVTIGELKAFGDRQYAEADKLLRRLDGYASEYAVPMEWREY